MEAEAAPLLGSSSESSRAHFEKWSQDRLSSFERIVVNKIDLQLMPLLCLLYVLNYLDRVCDLFISGAEPRKIAKVLTMSGLPLLFRIILLLRDSGIWRVTSG